MQQPSHLFAAVTTFIRRRERLTRQASPLSSTVCTFSQRLLPVLVRRRLEIICHFLAWLPLSNQIFYRLQHTLMPSIDSAAAAQVQLVQSDIRCLTEHSSRCPDEVRALFILYHCADPLIFCCAQINSSSGEASNTVDLVLWLEFVTSDHDSLLAISQTSASTPVTASATSSNTASRPWSVPCLHPCPYYRLRHVSPQPPHLQCLHHLLFHFTVFIFLPTSSPSASFIIFTFSVIFLIVIVVNKVVAGYSRRKPFRKGSFVLLLETMGVFAGDTHTPVLLLSEKS